ncbi:MAG: hypothetical protein LIP03_13085 [Bacteroidales bacterium]|nr:hypothetical protein [Bacteroidales bacterium]
MTAKTLITNNYLELLDTLSDEMKMSIINGLVRSLISKKKSTSLQSLFGAWKDDRSAEEIIDDIRSSRHTNTRHIESLD